jgi:two-component system response regulator FixJ
MSILPVPARADPPSGATIVVVTDDAALRTALSFSLEIDGFRVTACRSAEDLLRLDLPSAAACLVIDERLEGLSGLEALETLRARGVSLPAILITSFADRRLRAGARRSGAGVLEKPLLGDALRARIGEALGGG